MDRFPHWHLHNEEGMCFGDTVSFEHACEIAALHAYPRCVPDNEPVEELLTVIDAGFCIDVCREELEVESEGEEAWTKDSATDSVADFGPVI